MKTLILALTILSLFKQPDPITYDIDGNILYLSDAGCIYISYLQPNGTYGEPVKDPDCDLE